MEDIGKALKELRKRNNLTQEKVAQKIGVTRQAISSYESGRTQPGVELLMQFADIYGVSLEDILYGEKKTNKELFHIKVISIITASAWFVSQTLNIILYFISHIFYPIPTGQISDSMKEILEIHLKYSNAADLFEGLGYTALLIGGLILVVLDLSRKSESNLKTKYIIIGAFILCTLMLAIIGAFMVPLWRTNFLLTARLGIYRVLIFVIIDFIGKGIKRIHQRATDR